MIEKKRFFFHRSRFLFVMLSFLFVLLCQGVAYAVDGKYNVVLITVDTLRWDYVGYSGSKKAVTPAIDEMAAKAAIFHHAYSHNPVTLAAHANILTGRLPFSHGIRDNAIFTLDPQELTLAEFLKNKGYRTAAFIGAFPLNSRFGLNQGFDLYDEEIPSPLRDDFYFVERPAAQVLAPARNWISSQKGRWFTWIHLFDPHHPYHPPDPYRQKFPKNLYSGEISYVDAELGKFFSFLKKQKHLTDTIVIFTADHGEALGEKGEETHSYFAYNCTLQVPLFIYSPSFPPKSVRENASHTDLFPTICDILGVAPPKGLQGESLAPVINGKTRKEKRIYFESMTPFFSSSWAPLQGFIRGNLKFIESPIPEVYRLDQDPGENRNLAARENLVALKKELSALLQKNGERNSPAKPVNLDPEMQKKLRSLGYLSAGGSPGKKYDFSEKDDLKTMLPIYRLQEASLIHYQQRKFEDAIEGFKKVIEAAPEYISAYTNLGAIYLERGRADLALSTLRKGLSRSPGNSLLQSKLGLVYFESGNPEKAIPLYENSLKSDPENPELYNYFGLALAALGRIADAQAKYEKSLELDPRSAGTCNNLGNLLMSRFSREKNPALVQEAVTYYKRAKKLAPDMANARNGLAMALYKSGKILEAIAELTEAEKKFPGDFQILYNFGIILLETKRFNEALSRFEAVRKRYYQGMNEKQKQNLDALIAETRAKMTTEGSC